MEDKYRLKPKNINIEFGGMGMYGTADVENFAGLNMTADYKEAEYVILKKYEDDRGAP